MSNFFLTLPNAKNPLHSFLENIKNKVIAEVSSENVLLNEEEVDFFMKTADSCLKDSCLNLSLLKHLFSYREKLLKDQKYFINIITIINLHIGTNKNLLEREEMITEYLRNFHEIPDSFFNVKAKMLASLLNSFSVKDPKQYDIFKEILKLTDINKKVSIILPTIESIDEFLRNWGLFTNISKKREIYQLILNALYNNNKEKIAIDVFVKYLKTFEDSQDNDLNNPQDSAFIIANLKRFLNSDSFHYELFENIIHLKRVIHLEDKRLFEVLMLFIRGNLQGYYTWIEKNRDFLENSLGINEKKMEIKIRIKCLATFEDTGKAISFKEMAEKLHVAVEEVEDWVIMGIQNKIIEGKIDEFNQVIEISDNCSKYLEEVDVQKIQKKLGVLIAVFEGYLENLKKKKGN